MIEEMTYHFSRISLVTAFLEITAIILTFAIVLLIIMYALNKKGKLGVRFNKTLNIVAICLGAVSVFVFAFEKQAAYRSADYTKGIVSIEKTLEKHQESLQARIDSSCDLSMLFNIVEGANVMRQVGTCAMATNLYEFLRRVADTGRATTYSETNYGLMLDEELNGLNEESDRFAQTIKVDLSIIFTDSDRENISRLYTSMKELKGLHVKLEEDNRLSSNVVVFIIVFAFAVSIELALLMELPIRRVARMHKKQQEKKRLKYEISKETVEIGEELPEKSLRETEINKDAS